MRLRTFGASLGLLALFATTSVFAREKPRAPRGPASIAPSMKTNFNPGAGWNAIPHKETGLVGYWENEKVKGRSIAWQEYGGLASQEIETRSLDELASIVEESRAAIQEGLGITQWKIQKTARSRLKHSSGWLLEWEGSYISVGGKLTRFLERQFVFATKTVQIQSFWPADDHGFSPNQARDILSRMQIAEQHE